MKSILIVEDETIIRSSLRKLLELQSFIVQEAETVKEAAEHDLNSFSLIITDLRLPDAHGTDLISLAAGVPVMVLTSYASLKSGIDAMKLGAVDYIPKPFNFDELLATVIEITSDKQGQHTRYLPSSTAKPSYQVNEPAPALDDSNAGESGQSLDAYFVKFVLDNEDALTETEIADKLGISRKSLWMWRQKHGIPRKKSRKR